MNLNPPEPEPITRFFKGNGTPGSSTLTLADLMAENDGFEDSAWVYPRDWTVRAR